MKAVYFSQVISKFLKLLVPGWYDCNSRFDSDPGVPIRVSLLDGLLSEATGDDGSSFTSMSITQVHRNA